MSLAGRTALIVGATRGIGKAIAFKLAENGANVIIAGKTQSLHRFLPGTVFSIADEINDLYGKDKALPMVVDVRLIKTIKNAVVCALKTYGSLDILVNNFSAIRLKNLSSLNNTNLNLMFDINVVGSHNCIKESMGNLRKSKFGGHVVNISPPIDLNPAWFSKHAIYSLSKIGQSLSTFGLCDILGRHKIAINSLWSKNVINTGTSEYIYGKNIKENTCSSNLMAEAVLQIVLKRSTNFTGNFLYAEDLVLNNENPSELENYTSRESTEIPMIPNIFHGDPKETMQKRNDIMQATFLNNLFKRINESMLPDQTEFVGTSFTIEFEDYNGSWTIDCKKKNPQFHRIDKKSVLEGSCCKLIMTTQTLKEIIDKKLDAKEVAITEKIRTVGSISTSSRARNLLFNII